MIINNYLSTLAHAYNTYAAIYLRVKKGIWLAIALKW